MPNSTPLQPALQRRAKNSKSIFDASSKIDRGSLVKILRRAREFTDAITKDNALGEYFVVEYEIVGVLENRQTDQDISRKSPEARMILRQLCACENVLKCREETIGDILIEWHPPL